MTLGQIMMLALRQLDEDPQDISEYDDMFRSYANEGYRIALDEYIKPREEREMRSDDTGVVYLDTDIKRVIGIPGDWIEMDMDGTVYLNGEKLDEPYAEQLSVGECDLEFPFQVPQEQYFVLGDMRESSIDSRNTLIGCVEYDQVVGKVFFRIWPFKTLRFF